MYKVGKVSFNNMYGLCDTTYALEKILRDLCTYVLKIHTEKSPFGSIHLCENVNTGEKKLMSSKKKYA